MLQSLFEMLGAQGPLARRIPDFVPRQQQQEMAEAVAEALQQEQVLIAEAGTGTGKTFAYLVPALLSGKKVIISTGTKNLQDQLYHRDLPAVRAALDIPVTTALLKGRANYLCHYRLALREQDGSQAPALLDQLATVRGWLNHTRSGDIAELSDIAEDAPIWPLVTSTTDNCLGMECPNISDCFVMKARRAAQEADVLVVNHHLFFADMSLRDEGFGEVLPGANAFIFDEAHQLAEVATQYFGTSLSSRQLIELARDTRVEVLSEAPDLSNTLNPVNDALEKAARDLRLSLGETGQRAPWQAINRKPAVQQQLDAVQQELQQLHDLLSEVAERSTGLEKLANRAEDSLYRLELFITGSAPDLEQEAPDEVSDMEVLWYETTPRGFLLRKTPTSIANTFQAYMSGKRCSWVFTSATLSVAGKFGHFMRGLGIADAQTHSWDSPFDFQHQALLYLPQRLPEPNHPGYIAALLEAALPVIEASGGRTFFLVTSHRALQHIASELEQRISYPLLVQGSLPRAQLLERFRRLGNAVLVGTSSFWEGVDVKGEALSCVIIDKLPFAHPDEPILQARIELMRKRGENPFFDYQIPQAVISLKQGVGRLIRGTEDRGVLMLCDPRLLSKGYGRIFLNSLPPLPRTRELDDVQFFFHQP
jgi:ATP-dependent DNA helicase DinG